MFFLCAIFLFDYYYLLICHQSQISATTCINKSLLLLHYLTHNTYFADSCLTTWLCRRNAVISISDIDYIKYGLICQALFKNYSKIFYELKKRVYLFISLPIFLSAIEIVPSLLLINSIYLSSSKYSTGTVISMPVSVFIF